MAWFSKVERLYWEQWCIQLHVVPPAPLQAKNFSRSRDTGGQALSFYFLGFFFLLFLTVSTFTFWSCAGILVQTFFFNWYPCIPLYALYSFLHFWVQTKLSDLSWYISTSRNNHGWTTKTACSTWGCPARSHHSSLVDCKREKGSHSSGSATRFSHLIPLRDLYSQVQDGRSSGANCLLFQLFFLVPCLYIYATYFMVSDVVMEYVMYVLPYTSDTFCPFCSSSDSSFGMDMFKRMLQTGPPTMLNWTPFL